MGMEKFRKLFFNDTPLLRRDFPSHFFDWKARLLFGSCISVSNVGREIADHGALARTQDNLAEKDGFVIGSDRPTHLNTLQQSDRSVAGAREHGDFVMKVWTFPTVRESQVGLEVTSYLPAEIDIL